MAKVQLDITGKDKGASAAVKGVTKSIVTAQLAIEGIKMATTALINVGKKSIELFKTQEQILAKLAVQTNGNTEAIENWTSEIQEMTTIGDEASQQMASLGLSMGITEDKLEEATKGAIGLSEALGIDLNASMKMVALANEGEFNMLTRYIPALRTASTEAEKQAIVQNAMAKGFDLAQAKANTFTGRLEQLKNIQGDNLEAFGKVVSVIGKDFVQSMTDGQKALNDFLTDSDNIAKIGATFEILKTIFLDIKDKVFDAFKDAIGPIKEEFDELLGSAKGNVTVFDILGGVMKIVSIALNITIKSIKLVVTYFINLATIVKEVIKTLGAFWDAATGKTKWKDAIDAVKNVGKAYGDAYKDIFLDAKDMITSTIDEFKTFNTDTEASAEKYAEIWKEKNEKIKSDMEKQASELPAIIKKTGKTIKNTWWNELKAMSAETQKAWESMSPQGKFEKFTTELKKFGDLFLGVTTQILDTVKMAWEMHYENQFAQLENSKESQLESVDEWANREMESQGVRLATKQESLQQEISDIDAKLATVQDAEERAALTAQLKEKQDALKRQKILDDVEKKKAEIQERSKKKETALKKKQFEESKAFSIAQVWINAARAIMGFWAAYASIPIAGPIIAAGLSTVATAIAGVQTGLIASQSFHGAEGGEIPLGTATGDRAVTFMNKGEALLRNDDYKSLVDMARGEGGGGNGGIFIENMTVIAEDPEMFAAKMRDIQRYERVR